ncbi:hypothetical protein GGR52DRAFT_532871 [Hypoxylon sp. FL1284]|nr:hypothetical protein GGR52DRAFT_532871 [Hypoxylon sp. FL1284]
MASAQLMQEELQQSVVLSEEDAEFDEDLPDATMMDTSTPRPTGNSVQDGFQVIGHDRAADHEGGVDTEDEATPVAAEGEDDENFEDEPASDDDDDLDRVNSHSEADDEIHDDDDAFDIDAEREDDEEGSQLRDEDDAEQGAVEEDEDENEGVGAVKVKPGDTDQDSESEDDTSSALNSSDRESAAEWEEVADNNDNDDDEFESEDPDAYHTNCMFCSAYDEIHPAGEGEEYLTCTRCGQHAQPDCARRVGNLDEKNNASNWVCPDCAGDDAESAMEVDPERQDADGDHDTEMTGGVEDGDLSPTSASMASRSTAPKIARDLLPSHRGVNKPDSHSVFNQLVLDGDPMDGSRVLRKRKSSSVEPDEEVMSLRKRKKNTSEESVQGEAIEEQAKEPVAPVRLRLIRLRSSVPIPDAFCIVVKKSRSSLLVQMHVKPAKLKKIFHGSKTRRKRAGRATASRSRNVASTRVAAAAEPLPMAPFFASNYSQPFYSFYDKETDELKGKPYGGILTEEQADTTKTLPTKDDRRRFDEAKQKAEEEWRNRLLVMQAETAEAPVKKSKKASGPASQIECVEFGGWEIETWYAAPYPEEYSRNRVLYICEFCLKYMNSDYVAWRHKLKCPAKHPPGDEIYRRGSISFFEVDGRKNPVYCQNLCLLAKLFLGSKTLYYDVEPFLFYVLCEYDDLGYHFVGYFSKEKRASSQNNVSCILTLPIHQRKGYGHLLIDFSYLLTKVEEKTGSPEKPLSDMGLVSYRSYWRLVLCKYFLVHMPEDKSQKKGLSIRQISDDTGMTPDDVISALEALRFLVRDPATQVYAFRVDIAYCRQEVTKWEAKKHVELDPKSLTWTPYVMGRSNATNFELGPALNTIAPREEDEDVKAVQTLAESGIATGDFAVAQPVNQKPPAAADSSVLESTEPDDNQINHKKDVKINEDSKENREAFGDHPEGPDSLTESHPSRLGSDNTWFNVYDAIPITRFQVYPPISNRRTAMSRLNSSIARPPPPRLPPSGSRRVARPKARRSTATNSVRKSAQKGSSGKRKPGGTGRGPGRWPKGTKKSDYGNADSGPGLPPAWLERQKQKQGSTPTGSQTADDNAMQDTVQVQVEEATKGHKGKQIATLASKNAADTAATASSSLGPADGDNDIVMGEGGQEEHVDAGAEQA